MRRENREKENGRKTWGEKKIQRQKLYFLSYCFDEEKENEKVFFLLLSWRKNDNKENEIILNDFLILIISEE